MDSRKLSEWLQVVGLFSVLGGLIFVGMQLRLDRQVASSEGLAANNANKTEWAQVVTENADAWVSGLAGESMSAAEAAKFDAMADAYIFTYFTAWSRAENTLSGQDSTRFAIEAAIELHKYPGLLRHWRERQSLLLGIHQRLARPTSTFVVETNAEVNRLQSGASAD